MNQKIANQPETELTFKKGSEWQEMRLAAWKDDHEWEQGFVEQCLEAHEGDEVSRAFAVAVSLVRYFGLINNASLGVKGLFTAEEVVRLLDAFPRPTIDICGSVKLVEMYFDGLGVEALEVDSVEARLGEKLAKLTELEQVAVVEVLECAWSDRVVGPVAYAMSRLAVPQPDVV